MQADFHNIHPKFKLNGTSYTTMGLREAAYGFIKEGANFERHIGHFLSDWLNDKGTIEVKTSGSTGAPKKILLQKQHMVNSAIATGTYFELKAGEKVLLCLPAEYISGKMMLVRAMVLGLDLHCIEPSLNPLEETQKVYDFCAMVPLQLQNSLEKIARIKTLLVGGAPFSTSLKEQVKGKSTKIYETYGMTETTTHIALKQVNQYHGAITSIGVGRPFKALPNVFFRQDERSCLVIDAPKVADEPVVTNDLVNLISETEFEWLGRYDNIINSGGVKLIPEQIEEKLRSVLDQRFFVAGRADEELGQKLVLLVEGNWDSEELLHNIRSLGILSKFEIPKAIYQVPEFVMTDTGKIRRLKTLGLLA